MLGHIEDDIAEIKWAVDVQDSPMLLVGHSYRGMVIGEAGMDLDVRGVVYIAAFQPDVGESGGSLLAPAPSEFTVDKITVFEDGHYLVHEDAIFVAQSAAWHDKPSWSVVATLDRTIAPDLQRQMSQRAGSTVIDVENGHMLPMTSPEEVADVMRQAAEAVE